MDEIIRIVIERLQARSKSKASIDVNEDKAMTEQALLYNETILLYGLEVGHTNVLAKGLRLPWVQWLDQAITYGCDVTVQLKMTVNRLLSPSMILLWPVVFRDKQGHRIYSFDEYWVSATSIKSCEPGSVLLLYRGQRLTHLAHDEITLRGLTVVEGGEQYASR